MVTDEARIFHAPRFDPKRPARVECNCGWKGEVSIAEIAARKANPRDLYVSHLPLTDRKRSLRVNLFGGDMGYDDDDQPNAGAWILPAYDPVGLTKTYEADGLYYGITQAGEHLPILWIKLQDGRIFQHD